MGSFRKLSAIIYRGHFLILLSSELGTQGKLEKYLIGNAYIKNINIHNQWGMWQTPYIKK